jgi:hypothetical protein
MKKDSIQHNALYDNGWISLRLWEGDIINHPSETVGKIQKELEK